MNDITNDSPNNDSFNKISNYESQILEYQEYFNKYQIDLKSDLMNCGYIIK